MDKFLTRISVIVVAIYFIISYILAQFVGIDILRYSYILLFEACVVAYTFCSGKYHCRFIRWTALSIFVSDVISHTDYYLDYIPTNLYNFIPLLLLSIGLATSSILAIRHFYKVIKLKKLVNEHRQHISNQESTTSDVG